jgi:hypothetical protein
MAEETLLFHPSFRLKAMQASTYKGRPPGKGEATADEPQVKESIALVDGRVDAGNGRVGSERRGRGEKKRSAITSGRCTWRKQQRT